MTYLSHPPASAGVFGSAPKPSSLAAEWRRFLFFRLPVLLLVVLAVCQMLDAGLRRVKLRRSTLDDLALAVQTDRTAFRVIVLGDSITRETRRFQLGHGPHDVGNLATIGWTGAAAK